MNKKIIYLILSIALIGLLGCILLLNIKKEPKIIKEPSEVVYENTDFEDKIISEANKNNNDNFMISPLSIAYALSMLKEGATNNTKDEIAKLLGNYKLPSIINVKDRISLANLLFINEKYKKEINKDYINLLQTQYNSDLLFDKLNSPDIVNKWISDKTFNMINKAIDDISPQTVLGLANAIAIDLEWEDKFEYDRTKKEEFTLKTNEKMTTPMMHQSNDVAYFENKNAKGIVKNYKKYAIETDKSPNYRQKTIDFEYIAILPNNNIDDYLKTFNTDELNNLLSNKKYHNDDLDIYYSIPKYTFDYDYKKFKNSLISLGIKDAFDPYNSSFNNMKEKDSELNIYINEAIHKSHIELSENGTKASAVTVFMFKANAAIMHKDPKNIYIDFNKPFIFIIKEKNSDNIWFYGVVYKPMDFKDNPKYEQKNK